MAGMSAIDKLAYKHFFKTIDKDMDGKIDINEFTELLMDLNETNTRDSIRTIFEGADKDGDNRIDFEECMKIIPNPLSVDDIFLGKFQRMDGNHDGVLTVPELQFGLMTMHKYLKSGKIEELIKKVDTDGDEKVNYQEFLKVLTELW